MTEGFNRDNLDSVMEFFTKDALYVEFTGKVNRGEKKIRKAFEPQFRGDFGIMDSGRKDVDYEDWYGHKLDRKLLTLLQKY